MHTKDFLAQELRRAGLDDMALLAERGHYHDFLSPLDFPELELDKDLVAAMERGVLAAGLLRIRHHNGEFDATAAESEAWAQSPDGQETFGRLVRDATKGKP